MCLKPARAFVLNGEDSREFSHIHWRKNLTADAADFYSCGGCGFGVALRSC